MKKVFFTPTTKKFSFAEFAILKDGESPIDAVKRSIERTCGALVYAHRQSWTENRKKQITSECYSVTLAERREARRGGGHGVIGEFRMTVHLD